MRFLIIFCFFVVFEVNAQRDSLLSSTQIQADIILNTNGISRIPSLSLMKPALQANIVLTKGRWVVDPQFFFSLDGKPWINNFWLHYKLVSSRNFSLLPGGSLMVTHKTSSVQQNGIISDKIVASRYVDLDLLATQKIGRKTNLGAYYLYIHGLDPGTFQALHFGALSLGVSKIPIGKKWEMRLSPQVYYLTQGGMEGIYFSSSAGLKPMKSPFGLFGMINFPFQTNYVPDNGFIWSLGINWMPNAFFRRS